MIKIIYHFETGHKNYLSAVRNLYKTFHMQTISFQNISLERTHKTRSYAFSLWLESIKPGVIENRLGIVITLIILQFTVAGFNVCIPPMLGASIWVMAPGIFMAFMSNSIALAQSRMRYVLLGFALSIIINGAVSLYYAIQLLN